ncbi:MAG: hypothetical protein K940chlam2_00082 [Chlamydiae bacterium]|nr:hypothetical protein [Chlamydiota bacterium]
MRSFHFILFLCLYAGSHLFGSEVESSSSSQIINGIMSESPCAIKSCSDGKLYLHEDRVFLPPESDLDAYLCLDSGQALYLPVIFCDDEGLYLSVNSELLAKKMFKNKCNSCQFEWEGGALVFRCPNCRSTDFQTNIPNW